MHEHKGTYARHPVLHAHSSKARNSRPHSGRAPVQGRFVLEIKRGWSPIGAAHFVEMIKVGAFDGAPHAR